MRIAHHAIQPQKTMLKLRLPTEVPINPSIYSTYPISITQLLIEDSDSLRAFFSKGMGKLNLAMLQQIPLLHTDAPDNC